MIKYNPKNWFQLIFALHKSDTIRILWKELIYIGIFTSVIAFLIITYGGEIVESLEKLITLYSLIGFVISLLLVFRTNTAYDRWWEGRKKWGALVNNTRNLAIKIETSVSSPESRDVLRRMIANFPFAMKEHLRGRRNLDLLEVTEEERSVFKDKEHLPVAISHVITAETKEARKRGEISEEEYITIDTNINALLDSLGACERIKNTPIPFSYSLFIKKFIFIYVTTIPLAFITVFGYYSVLIALFVFYVLVSMEVLAEEIEDPFGEDDNDLPTDDLSEKIRANVNEIFKD
jgi:putative membrane protein